MLDNPPEGLTPHDIATNLLQKLKQHYETNGDVVDAAE